MRIDGVSVLAGSRNERLPYEQAAALSELGGIKGDRRRRRHGASDGSEYPCRLLRAHRQSACPRSSAPRPTAFAKSLAVQVVRSLWKWHEQRCLEAQGHWPLVIQIGGELLCELVKVLAALFTVGRVTPVANVANRSYVNCGDDSLEHAWRLGSGHKDQLPASVSYRRLVVGEAGEGEALG